MQKEEKLTNTEASLTKYLNNFLTDVEKILKAHCMNLVEVWEKGSKGGEGSTLTRA